MDGYIQKQYNMPIKRYVQTLELKSNFITKLYISTRSASKCLNN